MNKEVIKLRDSKYWIFCLALPLSVTILLGLTIPNHTTNDIIFLAGIILTLFTLCGFTKTDIYVNEDIQRSRS